MKKYKPEFSEFYEISFPKNLDSAKSFAEFILKEGDLKFLKEEGPFIELNIDLKSFQYFDLLAKIGDETWASEMKIAHNLVLNTGFDLTLFIKRIDEKGILLKLGVQDHCKKSRFYLPDTKEIRLLLSKITI